MSVATPSDDDSVSVGDSVSISVGGGVGGNMIVGHHIQVIGDASVLMGPPDEVHLSAPLMALPKVPARVFVGRDDALAALDAVGPEGSVVVTQAVHGLGGVGKTELVLHYVDRHRDRWPIVWWITADSPDRIEAGLAALTTAVAARIGKPAPAVAADAAAWAVGFLVTHPGWLIVLDNVEDRADIDALLGNLSGGRVLITSRRDVESEQFADACIRLDLLSSDAAVRLLTGRSGQAGPETVAALARELGFLPLALTQAAAFLAETRMPMAEYLERLRQRPAGLLAAGAGGMAQQTVARVWDLTLAAIRTANPLAIDVLRVLAAVAPDNVPRALLSGSVRASGSDSLASALGLLASYSMITLTEATVATHRLVQAVVAAQAEAAGAWAVTLRRARDLIGRAQPRRNPQTTVADWPLWAALVPHIQALADNWPDDQYDSALADLLTWGGIYLSSQGADAAAVEFDRQALANYEATLGPDHANTLNSRNSLASGYRAVGRLVEAMTLSEQIVAARIRVYGADDPDTLISRSNLAIAYQAVGRLADAVGLYEQTLADRIRILGTDHPDTLASRANLAAGYRAVGRQAEAIALLERTLADRVRVLGADHPNTLASRGSLASGYRAVGRQAEAIALLEQTLAGRMRVLGPDHPATFISRHHLATDYRSVGRLAEAIALFEQTLDDRVRVLGPDHPDTLTSRHYLATSYRGARRYGEAITLFEQTLADRIRVLGPDHPDTLHSRNSLATGYRAAGRIAEAITLFEQALADRTRVLGPDHPDTRLSRTNLERARQQ